MRVWSILIRGEEFAVRNSAHRSSTKRDDSSGGSAMKNMRIAGCLGNFRTLFETGSAVGLSDEILLEDFATHRGAAESAFVALVARHGPMVQGVCRRLLSDPHDVDDAFQATFLVLARKARAIQRPDRLSSWLFGTACRVAKKLKADAARRRTHESQAALAKTSTVDDTDRVEEAQAVIEEVARLPESCRAVVVLCELEGLTRDEAARQLRCSERTVRRRWVRARTILRVRLTTRGLAPAAATLISSWTAETAAAAISASTVDATARAATRFAAGAVPASTSAMILVEGVVQAMLWSKLKAVSVAAGLLLAFGLTAGVVSGFSPRVVGTRDDEPQSAQKGAHVTSALAKKELPPAEQFRALVKRWDDAVAAYRKAAAGKNQAQTTQIYMRLGPFLKDHSPAFVALAERYPKDPAAVDALLWVVEKRQIGSGQARIDRTLELLARNHAGDPRIGPICIKSMNDVSPEREAFLKAIAQRSPNRVVQGQANFALAEYLGLKAIWTEIFQKPDAPENEEKIKSMIVSLFGPDVLKQLPRETVAEMAHPGEQEFAKSDPSRLRYFREADPAAIRRESALLFKSVIDEFADVPHARFDGRPTRETLGDVAGGHHPGTTADTADRFQILEEAFLAAEQKACDDSNARGQDNQGLEAEIAAAPKWAEFGRKMWQIAVDAPRSPDGFNALLWIFQHQVGFFDNNEERAGTLDKAVDALIRDHLDFIALNLGERTIATAFNDGYPLPAPHVDRLYRALYEQGKSRETRGRMGLMLARHLKVQAELVESLTARGIDPARRPEIAMLATSYVEWLQKTGALALHQQAEAVFERVQADYGDIKYLHGTVLEEETLAAVADRELIDIRTLRIGQTAPEITGEDIDGKPMTLSEYRGKVVLLDFGSHEHCGGCRLAYPRLKAIIDQYRGRPFAVLGINNNDNHNVLKELKAKGEITWRCWWDGGKALEDGPGPITMRWNVQAYPSFIVLDHRGAIRFKDLFPQDERGFGEAIMPLLEQAERAAAKR
jgi:RNA polymerase sigma factor (sigma-70 family)